MATIDAALIFLVGSYIFKNCDPGSIIPKDDFEIFRQQEKANQFALNFEKMIRK